MKNLKQFYTYAYLREDRTPYYIGKGAGNRAYSKNHNINLPPKERILFLKHNLTEEEAFKHEKYMITVLGRKDLGTGILRNRTDGGEGVSGRIISEETKTKLSKSKEGKNHHYYGIIGKLHPRYGSFHTQETKEKIRNSNIGKKHSKETKEKLKKLAAKKYEHVYYEIMTPDGNVEYVYTSLKEYSINKGLKPGQMYRVANGKNNHHHGFKIIKHVLTL